MFWFYDGLHYPEPMYPFDIIWDEAWFLALSQFNTRIFIVPPAMGIDHRIHNGYIYITPLPVANPEEIPKRAELFMKRAGYYYQKLGQVARPMGSEDARHYPATHRPENPNTSRNGG